jgi:hypothetical protein
VGFVMEEREMDALNEHLKEYAIQLKKGHIQQAYKGIMVFMTELKTYLERKYPDYHTSTLYYGYMDMTYIAFTPADLRKKMLKIAIVYLHEECRFEIWLAGTNRQIQSDTSIRLSRKNIGFYVLSQIHPGVDSIIASTLTDQPNFDKPDELKALLEIKTMNFIQDMESLLSE